MKQKGSRLLVISLLLFAHSFAMLPAVSAKAISVRFTDVYDLYNDCEDEWIRMTVEIHFRAVSNGGLFESFLITTTGTGVGDKGNRYNFISSYKDDFGKLACGATATSRFYGRLISQGKADNRLLETVVTYGSDADCNISLLAYSEKILCNG
jgi:hypothetical protein